MEFDPQHVVLNTQQQLLNLWFEVYLLKGHRVSQAARRSHAQALHYLRAVGVPDGDLLTHLMSEDEWVRAMLASTPGGP